MFGKKIVRANTSRFYRQKRFNLIREETEGYSKLIVEIYKAAYGKSNLNKVETTASTIVSLIGYFDLDPVKALDVFLDISASNLVAHSPFFIRVLKKSPWWPTVPFHPTSITELGDGGNEIAAQIIGFKLQSFIENDENVPENLIMLIAVLIKEGFLSLGSIYPYLSPSDDTLVKLHEQWKSDIEERAFLTNSSALAMAAPLTDESGGDNKNSTTEPEAPKLSADGGVKYPFYQKTAILHALLSVGSIKPALFMLSRYPKIVDPYPEIADLLLKITDYAIEPLYTLRGKPPLLDTVDLTVCKSVPTNANQQQDITLTEPFHSQTRRGLIPVQPVTDANPYRFFYETWSSEIQHVTDLEGLRKASRTFLRLSGPLLSRNINLLVKLCRIGVSFCRTEKEDDSEVISYWIEYARNYILPTIPLLEPNPGTIQEIFNLFRLFPFETRYSLYGEWQTNVLRSSPHLRLAASKAEKDTKNVLKRLSNTNVREMMRKLAKVSYSNPISCFKVFIGQVESYDNLATLVVEAARYFTDMGWDVFPFIIMIQMTSGRGTQQMDGLNERKWIQSLASFTAKLCRRYSYMDPRPLLLFLLRKLHSKDLSFVIVLRELISQMAGIAQLSNLTTSQVENLGGGSVLRSKVFEAIDDEREVVAKAGRRLVDSFISLKIFSEMFILLNQLHQTFIYTVSEDQAREKVLASRYDDLTHILIQFMEMTTYYMDTTTFKANMAPVVDLCIDFGVDVAYAFGIWRPYLGDEIRGFDPSQAESDDAEMEKAFDENDPDADKWHPILRTLVRDIQNLFPEKEWQYLKPGFFVTFWQLSLYDIQYPSERYVTAERKLTESITALGERIRILENANNRESSQQAKQIRNQRDNMSQQQAKLSAESKRHALHFEKSKARLRSEKNHWFDYKGPEAEEKYGMVVRRNITKQLLAKCILPRALTSPIDAIFSARFIQLLHSIGTHNFSSLMFYDKLFSDGILYGTLLTCTSYEAENLGLFLSELLGKLMQWRENSDIYTDEGLGKRYVEDNVSFLPGLRFAHDIPETTEANLLSHTNFKTALEKWNRFTKDAVVDCLKSDIYMHRSNAITLLRNMIEVFPAITTQGWEITDRVEDIAKNEEREDLKLMANALLVHLKRRSKSWIEIYNFKDVKPDVKEELIKASKAAARERESKSQQRHTPLSVANSNNASSGSKRSQSPAVSTGTSTPVPLTNISRRDSRTALDNKQSGNLPASLPKIPSGPRRADDGPPSRSTSISQPESRRQPIQINGIAESSRGGHNRDNSGRYGRRGGNDTPSEAPLRQSFTTESKGSRGSGRSGYRDEETRTNSGRATPNERRDGGSRTQRSGHATPDSRDHPSELRRSGNSKVDLNDSHSRASKDQPSTRRGVSGGNLPRDHADDSRDSRESRKGDTSRGNGKGGQQSGRLKDDSGVLTPRRIGSNASSSGAANDKDSSNGSAPPKGPKGEHGDRDDRTSNNRRDRERRDEEREREREREREKEKDQRSREKEREIRNREREKDKDRAAAAIGSFEDRRNHSGGRDNTSKSHPSRSDAKSSNSGDLQEKPLVNVPSGPEGKRGARSQEGKGGRGGNGRQQNSGNKSHISEGSDDRNNNPNGVTSAANSQPLGRSFEERISGSTRKGNGSGNSGRRGGDRDGDRDRDNRRGGGQSDRRGGNNNNNNQRDGGNGTPNINQSGGPPRDRAGGPERNNPRQQPQQENNDRMESRQRNDKEREARRRERDGRDPRPEREERGGGRGGNSFGGRSDRERGHGGSGGGIHRGRDRGDGGNLPDGPNTGSGGNGGGGGGRGRKHMRSGEREAGEGPEKRRRMNR